MRSRRDWRPVVPRRECQHVDPITRRQCRAHLTWRAGLMVCPVCNTIPRRHDENSPETPS